jgi:uncharacterized protein
MAILSTGVLMQIKRDKYLHDLILRQNNGLVKVITGIRRSGKSFLLNEIFYQYLLNQGTDKSHIIKFAFDSADDLELIGENLFELQKEIRKVDPQKFVSYIKSKVTDNQNYYLLLDEVQLLESFESVLDGYLYKQNLDVYVTGSNSKFLSTDVITEFRGRGDEVHVYPLSFAEFTSAFNGDKYEAWNEYFVYGGLPFVATLKTDEQKIRYLQNLFEETYIKDIIERHKIKKTQELENLINVLASATGSLTNATRIQNTFQSSIKSKISVDTVIDYIGCLKESFIINEAERYDVKGRKYIGSQQKYYFEDVGLRNARLNFRQTEENHIMENIIYNELRYRGFSVDVGVVEKRIKDEKGKEIRTRLEIDFVANKGSERCYIQSAFAVPDKEKELQEKKSLQNVGDSFTKIIVVKDPVKMSRDENGIITVGIFDFLLKTVI